MCSRYSLDPHIFLLLDGKFLKRHGYLVGNFPLSYILDSGHMHACMQLINGRGQLDNIETVGGLLSLDLVWNCRRLWLGVW